MQGKPKNVLAVLIVAGMIVCFFGTTPLLLQSRIKEHNHANAGNYPPIQIVNFNRDCGGWSMLPTFLEQTESPGCCGN